MKIVPWNGFCQGLVGEIEAFMKKWSRIPCQLIHPSVLGWNKILRIKKILESYR